jgi:uncharacterized protein
MSETPEEVPGQMSVAEAGKRGGKSTAKKYGKEFYSSIGAKGGKATSKNQGTAFYKEIGRKGGAKVRDLIRKAQEMEANDG